MYQPNVSSERVLSAVGNDWKKVSFPDLLGMVTGAPYQAVPPPIAAASNGVPAKSVPVSRYLVGLAHEHRLEAVEEFVEREEAELHLGALLEFGMQCPQYHCRTVAAVTRRWPLLSDGIALQLLRSLDTDDHGLRQLVCAILAQVKLVPDGTGRWQTAHRLQLIRRLETLYQRGNAHDTVRFASQALKHLCS